MASRFTSPPELRESLQVDANVIRQLGEQLITDPEQALLELIKNSYDADATSIRITIDTSAEAPDDLPLHTSRSGVLTVEDDGTGMDLDAVRQGWLTISLSQKRAFKSQGRKTKWHHRTPVGDKGLGRLGTMKLGDILDIETFTGKEQPGYRVTINWSDFQPGELISEINVPLRELPSRHAHGTRLSVYGLADPDYWRGAARLAKLEAEMSTLVSPFAPPDHLRVTLRVDGRRIELQRLTPELRDTATSSFTATWDDEILECNGSVKLAMFRARTEDEVFARTVLRDDGKELFEFLQQQRAAKGFSLRRSSRPGWFIDFERHWTWAELPERTDRARIDRPGPFRAELDHFDLDPAAQTDTPFLSSPGQYRDFVKRHAGVTVYRDGFAVRMREDWLGLGKAWTSGRGYYGLKPGNTLGYVAISAERNPALQEKSDREGFLDTPASNGFFHLLDLFVKFTHDSQNFIGRAYVDFQKREQAAAIRLPTEWKPADAALRLKQLGTDARDRQKSIAASGEKWSRALGDARRKLVKSRSSAMSARERTAADETVAQLDMIEAEWERLKASLSDEMRLLNEEEQLAHAVVARFESLASQMEEMYDTVAIGLAAQALAHDIHALLDDLTERTNRIGRRDVVRRDPALAGYVEAVRGMLQNVRKQIAFIDPMLRTARETRQHITVSDFLEEYFDLRGARLKAASIAIVLDVRADFTIVFSRGRLLQVLDNLVRNSEYWINQAARTSPKQPREIRVTVDRPRVTISDSAKGVNPAIEDVIFDLFVTDKPRGQGSGLGLFIVRQILEREKCYIFLAPERNEHRRRNTFVVDLGGALA